MKSKFIKFKKCFLLWPTILLVLSGCSVFGGDDDPMSFPSTATFSLATGKNANANISGDSSPIEVRVFELEDDSMFISASYEELTDDFKDALRSNYVEDYDYVLLPNRFKFVEPITLDEETRYIGVMGMYSDPNKVQWKKVIKIKPKGHEYHLIMLFNEKEVVLRKVE